MPTPAKSLDAMEAVSREFPPEGGCAPLSLSPARLSRAALEPRHPAGGPDLSPRRGAGEARARSASVDDACTRSPLVVI